MMIVDRLLVGGLRFVLDKIATAVDAELNDADRLREELLAAQMQLELGQITEAEFVAVERAISERLREIRQRQLDEAAGEDLRIGGVEISIEGEHDEGRGARGGGV